MLVTMSNMDDLLEWALSARKRHNEQLEIKKGLINNLTRGLGKSIRRRPLIKDLWQTIHSLRLLVEKNQIPLLNKVLDRLEDSKGQLDNYEGIGVQGIDSTFHEIRTYVDNLLGIYRRLRRILAERQLHMITELPEDCSPDRINEFCVQFRQLYQEELNIENQLARDADVAATLRDRLQAASTGARLPHTILKELPKGTSKVDLPEGFVLHVSLVGKGNQRNVQILGIEDPNQDKSWLGNQVTGRRMFMLLGLGVTSYLYYLIAFQPLRHIGKLADTFYGFGKDTLAVGERALSLIMGRKVIEDSISELAIENDIPKKLIADFKKNFSDQKKIIHLLENHMIDYDTWSQEFNDYLRDTSPGTSLRKFGFHDLATTMYNLVQKNFGRDVGTFEEIVSVNNPQYQEYINDFELVLAEKQKLQDALRGIEVELLKRMESGESDREELLGMMKDYLILVRSRNELYSLVNKKGIGSVLQQQVASIDSHLEKELGKDFMKYVDAFGASKEKRWEYILPFAGGALVLTKAGIILWKVSNPADKIAKSVKPITRRSFLGISKIKGFFGGRR